MPSLSSSHMQWVCQLNKGSNWLSGGCLARCYNIQKIASDKIEDTQNQNLMSSGRNIEGGLE